MECKIEGRQPRPAEDTLLEYGLKGLMPGQKKYALMVAAEYIQKVLMDPAAPPLLKELLRSQNAVGMLYLQLLLAAFYREESE